MLFVKCIEVALDTTRMAFIEPSFIIDGKTGIRITMGMSRAVPTMEVPARGALPRAKESVELVEAAG
ncbi:MAG: hypothetical protein A2268_01025 [Candidatus Raymondbacteria bacterium RifOxyA12_full_50_37]|nr:MAG: hypothetical protein A2268_01025 [Candidatus Raymondbacteria bacterium RifOxyA12_full_50_37]OGJ86385.1 MAG: hypothetical protein A2248_13990 [Candidatus Raymondbacteria bacterium RIFOXYA2_FULL_49_16]OGJ95555.1 MAG: hypothetical protein A2453_12765 [Candidatus Raymondbacteria bacterium RIFOXYC2_FULL_50_21]OGJ99452.1 MAG: hypothetical protein A2487_07520 [Candidatus Raymondbacteria bacterium RifOxyC12_full_50_8]OGJ99695.1 MAG: hypothetical protein A2350_07565 [Candidatus Raymondbacteria b